jgi:RNA polymerase sporulation-specific sigma factor
MGRMSFPQKAENEKLVEWVKRAKAGNDDEAFEQIVKTLHTYLQHLSLKKFRIAGNQSDDVYQEGLVALSTKAIPDYREEKGAFLSFAKLCIRRHIITVLKAANNNKSKALNGAVSLDSTASQDKEDGPVPISEFLNNGEEDVVDSFTRLEIHSKLKSSLLGKLTSLEKHVFECYLLNMSYLDIVKAMNKHRRGANRVDCKVIDNALCRIKKKAIEIEEELRQKRGEANANDEDNDDR